METHVKRIVDMLDTHDPPFCIHMESESIRIVQIVQHHDNDVLDVANDDIDILIELLLQHTIFQQQPVQQNCSNYAVRSTCNN